MDFNPRAPCGARLVLELKAQADAEFQSTRPVWGATGAAAVHARGVAISIHAPRVGRDLIVMPHIEGGGLFQSTRPVWGATFHLLRSCPAPSISIHAPRVGRDDKDDGRHPRPHISIHAPRVGRDLASDRRKTRRADFNPRAPCGARRRISAHRSCRSYFNPRAPCGARPFWQIPIRLNVAFQSTRPVWGATPNLTHIRQIFMISIHAPRVGRDQPRDQGRARHCHFNPRAPCGARQPPTSPTPSAAQFQSTRPVWGATSSVGYRYSIIGISIHAPRVGRDAQQWYVL